MSIIVTVLNYDQFFIKQMLVLLKSLEINSPKDTIIVHLVDFPIDEVKWLEKTFKKYYFINSEHNVNKMRDPAGFMVCYRSTVIYQTLIDYHKSVAWVDCDIIVRKDLITLWEGIKSNQFKIVCRGEDLPVKNRFQAGVFAIGYSKETLQMMSEWEKVTRASNQWFADQLLLYEIYQKYSKKIELIPMNRSLNDIGDSTKECFMDDSVIWHCKRYHFNNKKFQKEFQYYLNKIKK